MNWKTFVCTTLLGMVALPASAAPSLTAVAGGIQSGNWVWTIDITPDLTLVPDNSGTPLAVELGFRLTGAELISASIANPAAFDTPNPGSFIFGWETPDPLSNNRPVGLQTNLATSEIFTAYGSGNFTTPGARHFLTVMAAGPGSGPASLSSTIHWLGVYGSGGRNGRITQVTGLAGTTYQTSNFDIFFGSATQFVPEPQSYLMLVLGTFGFRIGARRRFN